MDASTAWIIVGLYGLGLVLPVYGLVSAYLRVTKTHRRNEEIRAFRAEESDWSDAEVRRLSALPYDPQAWADLSSETTRRAEAAGMPIVTGKDFAVDLGLPEPGGLAEAVHTARGDLWIIGAGLLCATAASIWATLASIG